MKIVPVILCGGSGTRLWPLSRPKRPKPFLPLLGKQTLFEATLARCAAGELFAAPLLVTGEAQLALVEGELGGSAIAGIIVEPAVPSRSWREAVTTIVPLAASADASVPEAWAASPEAASVADVLSAAFASAVCGVRFAPMIDAESSAKGKRRSCAHGRVGDKSFLRRDVTDDAP